MKNKFFMGSIATPLILGAIVLAIAGSVYYFRRTPEVVIFFSILTVLVICALINFAKTDEQGITFFSFCLLPARYDYSDIIALKIITPAQTPDATGVPLLFLKNGRRKLLKLGLYSRKKQEELIALMKENGCNHPEFYQDLNRLDYWMTYARKHVMLRRLLIGGLLWLMGIIFLLWSTNALMELSGIFLILIGIPFFLYAFFSGLKKINIPEQLKTYLAGISQEESEKLIFSICGECKIGIGKISGGYLEKEDRYGLFPPAHSIIVLLIQLFFMLLSIFLGLTLLPHFLLAALGIIVLIWTTIFPRGVVFDWKENKIYWFRFFSSRSIPAKLKRQDVLNSSDLIALSLTIRNDETLQLSCVRKDGVYIPLAKAGTKWMPQLLSDTEKLAEKLGNLPIITI